MRINYYVFNVFKETTTLNPLLRSDNRCGSAFPLEDGSPAQCNPYGDNYCCSKWGFCGFTSEHCDCSDCINYRKEKSVNITEGIRSLLIFSYLYLYYNLLKHNCKR